MHALLLSVFVLIFFGISLIYAANRPPNIYEQPPEKDIFYKRGEAAEILCVADGIPAPRYLWTRNGKPYNPRDQGGRVNQLPNEGTIVFGSTMVQDEGIYQCFADNGYGTSASIRINLRMAKLGAFHHESKRIHEVEAGEPLTLVCVPPASYPPASIVWVSNDPTRIMQPVSLDKRVSMDLEGRLHFTNVKKSDEQSGRTYSCMAINYILRVHSIGAEHVLKVAEPKIQQYYPPLILWTSPSYHVILKGETLKLKCIFAGQPTPNVYWKKVDGTFPERAQYISFGQELDINNIQESDAGEYMCMDQITHSSKTLIQNFYVKVESAPYWIEEPANVEINANKNAHFICKADGDPKPKYTWYINGVPIEGQSEDGVRDPRIYNNNRFSKKDANSLELANVTENDLMNIQCNASNRHGYVFSDVYLNVYLDESAPEKPTIIKPPPAEIKVAEGKPVTLDCLVRGNPYPEVTWYRYEMVISGGRFQTMPNGNLVIQEVRMEHAGDYHCRARNIHGEVTSSTCTLIIRRKTRIEQRPSDSVILAGEHARFVCSGITDHNEVENLEVYWEKDGIRVLTNGSRLTQNEENSLTIWGAFVRDSGVYTCVVTNGLDDDRASAVLTVKDRPDPPSGVEIERCLASSADIKWIKGADNNSPILSFIVQYNTSLDPEQWISAKTVNYTQNTTTVTLRPWGNYTFRVLATNRMGVSYPSYQTKTVCRTPPAPPYTNPQNVRSIRDTRNMLKIQWTPMNELEHNGPGFRYQLTVKEDVSAPSYIYRIDDWRQDTIEIPTNHPYTPYLVKLQAKNYLGDAMEEPTVYTLYSFEDVPNVTPIEVEVKEIGNTFATVTWKWDSFWLEERGEITQIHGQLKGFKIQYSSTNETYSTFQEAEIPLAEVMPKSPPTAGNPISSFFLLENLPQFYNMQVQIRVYNSFYDGPPSDAKEFFTFGVPRPPKIDTQFPYKNIYFSRGERVEILCEADGIPRPRYQWKRNGESFYPYGQGNRVVQLLGKGTLVFNNTEAFDEGVYQCFADNDYGTSVSDKVYLRMAILGQFADEPGLTHNVNEGNHLTLPCIPPVNYPPADVFWALKERDGNWQPVEFDNRVSLDMEGRLRFTNVIKDDEQVGRAYCCVAQNQYMRAIAFGPEHIVEVLGVDQYMRPVEQLWTSPSDQLFLRGETLKLKCIFSGNYEYLEMSKEVTIEDYQCLLIALHSPTPEVRWNKVNGTLPDRAIHTSFGQELQIPNIQESDAGEYECEAWNMASPTSAFKTVHVRIESASYWIEKPGVVEASLNEGATFVCKTGGDPKPQYTWYINGVQLGELNEEGSRDPRIYNNERFFHKDENSITLFNVTQEDNMNIQCNASNKHGYVFSDVYLNVWYAKPIIIKHPSADVEVVEKSSVTIDCLVKGKPEPTITWYKNQMQIFDIGGTFHILPNGNLQIQNVTMTDAGYYRCRAENMYGEVTSSTCKLQIRRQIKIEQPPQELEVIAGNNTSLTCSGYTDLGKGTSMEVYWEKDGIRVSTIDSRLTQNAKTNSLTVWEAIVMDSGVYTCVYVTNELDEVRASTNLIVKVTTFEPVFKDIANNMTAIQGEDATLPCTVLETPDKTEVKWTDPNGAQLTHNEKVLRNSERYSVIHSYTGIWNLQIKDVDVSDSGTYVCESKTDTTRRRIHFTVKVPCPPKINTQFQYKNIYFIRGESVEILCEADGIPSPRYQWKRNGESFYPYGHSGRVVQLLGKGTLVLNKTEAFDEGIYQCFADNGYGTSVSDKVYLRMAILGQFADDPGSTHRVNEGNHLTLPCIPPVNYPPADVFWALKERDGNWQPVQFDSRVSLDMEGRLRFTNVIKDDEHDGRAYSCVALNRYLEAKAIGPEHFVEVLGATEQYYPTSELWTSPSNQIFLKGETMKLKCIFAGNPTTDVRWKRLDENLSDQARLKSFGQELNIANVQESDSGQYECRDRSSTIYKTFHVKIESAPNWAQEPENVVARINENATFDCKADGEPKPDYAWYINGVPLKDSYNEIGVRDPRIYNNARFKKNENRITMTTLALEDHMNIQCNASNKPGYVFSDVYLYVSGSEGSRP